ncbi:MAG TPA: NeuD/PglB/VioB family sugar acetyltransferase [Saprospiraceae bacterium]|nr:NeuD/PglB/VioB family sugar acetyltransferase [Saprospiraceae bacterium]HMQ84674.1 NeuD/PglB/VioB family sugar acetyltransferase [Saprospiraceae bacterium]
MDFDKKICIAGAGGFAREVLCCLIDKLESFNKKIEDVACFMVPDDSFSETKILGVEVIPQSRFNPKYYNAVVAIGNPATRKRVVKSLPRETKYVTIIHPSAIISKWVEIGTGTIITAGTIITCNIKIGNHTHLNLNTTIGHDCFLGDFFTTAPAVNVSGNCKFGECVYLGTNASVKEGINVCNDVVIGMGSVVVKNIQEPGIYIGNPARKLEKNKD